MNLVLHQFRKDILRTRVVLALWLLLVVLQFALVGWTAKPGDAVMQSLYPMLSELLTVFNYLLVLVLVPLLVHQEPLVGTTAFWFTRPLARTTLLASKALYILMLISLPILAQSIVFLANGVTLHDIALAAPELLINNLSWILIIATLAVFTPNFARFAIVGAIILVIQYLALFAVQMVMLMKNPQGFISTLASLTSSRALVVSLIMLGFGSGVVLLQYLTRRFTLAITLAITSLILSLLVPYVWSWDFLKPSIQIVEDTGFKADSVSANLTSPILTLDQPALRGGTPLKLIRGNMTFKNKPEGYIVQIGAIDSVLKSADGQKIPLQPANGQIGFSGNIDPDAVELALGGVPVLNMAYYNSSQNQQVLFNLDAENYGRYANTPLDYSASLACTACKYVATTELPLTKGARFDRGSEHLIVTDVLNQPDGVNLLLRQRNVRLLFAPRGQDSSPYQQDQSSVIYVLLNKARHQAVIQKLNTNFNFDMLNNGILRNEQLRISFGPDDNNRNNNWLAPQIDKAWLADAVLVRLELTPVATFTRTLTISGFRLDGKFDLHGSRFPSQVADLDTLDQITLPHDATREQVRNYVTDILVASRRQNSWGDHDPQVDMLKKVGSENVDLLVQMARNIHNYYLNHAINALAQPDHKDMIIAALATNEDLVDTVIDHGWQRDAKTILLSILADKPLNSSSKMAVAVASLKDPSTYDVLKAYYIGNPSDDLLKALQTMPGFDVAGTVDLAWKQARISQPWQVRQMLETAAHFGEPDVMEIVLKILKSKEREDNYSRQQARKVLKDYTPATGTTDAYLIKWLESNRANLIFDHQTGKYVLSSSPPSPAPVNLSH
ncbi:MAG: hypothetical protein LV481_16540 [Methylacidiphilales bacterium]|nr:hypothetical protein [Candidatus Methylacidiphilales bacterium]